MLRGLLSNQGCPGISITPLSAAFKLASVQAGLVGKVLTPARWSHSQVPEDRGHSITREKPGNRPIPAPRRLRRSDKALCHRTNCSSRMGTGEGGLKPARPADGGGVSEERRPQRARPTHQNRLGLVSSKPRQQIPALQLSGPLC